MRHPIGLTIASAALAWGATAAALAAPPPAFPGAVGQGAAATGGRGGDVYHVTTLRDYDSNADEQKIPGSLRHAIRSAEGPRTIVFDVSGPIALACQLEVLKDNITIAGQTSPGGITLWGYPFEVSGASDVVVRFLRVRLGDFHARRDGQGGLDASSAGAVNIVRSQRVVLDHVSAAWGMDETLSVTHSRDITVQNCIISESLNDSFHTKGEHGYGSLLRGELTAADRAAGRGGYTFYGNLWANHRARCPSVGGQQSLDEGQEESERRSTDLNLVNNVVYNWGDMPTHRSNDGLVRLNLLGNYYLNGPAKDGEYIFRGTDTGRTLVRHADNYHDETVDGVANGERIDENEEVSEAFRDMQEADEVAPAAPPFDFLGDVDGRVSLAPDAYQSVLQQAGASLWRDAVDRRAVESVTSGGGALIDSQERFREGGRLPGIDDLQSSKRPEGFDTDRDGVPDSFERRRGLDPGDPADGGGRELSEEGYTNLEVYLDEAARGASS